MRQVQARSRAWSAVPGWRRRSLECRRWAAETKLCAWLSVSTFAGLVAYALGRTWIDPVVGFVIAAFAVMEGKEAWEGELVEDDDDDDDDSPLSRGSGASRSMRSVS
ncbi:hypothetical protein [Nonomuraea sp. 10N515B]|uniref:hypothetical protein n=1 Tax=Nonomuraea sp. 10N515B TaxID=3457422 RepID=UPI003FCD7284